MLLGDGVRVVRLPAQPRPQVAVDLLRRAVGEHVVAGRHVPGDGVRRAPELLLDEEPLDVGPALAAVLGAVQPAAEPALQRLLLDAGDRVGGQASVRALGLLLERDQDLVDERAGARLQLGLGGGQPLGGCGGGGAWSWVPHLLRGHRVGVWRARVNGSWTRPSRASPVRGSTTRGSRGSRPTRASPRRPSTTTSSRARPCWPRRSSTPTSAPATCACSPARTAPATALARLRVMIDQCLPAPGSLRDDFILWAELWLRAARHPELQATSARLYERMCEWFAEVLEEGAAAGEFAAPDLERAPTASSRSATATASACCARTRRCRASVRAPRSGRRSRSCSAWIPPRRAERRVIARAPRARRRSACAAAASGRPRPRGSRRRARRGRRRRS